MGQGEIEVENTTIPTWQTKRRQNTCSITCEILWGTFESVLSVTPEHFFPSNLCLYYFFANNADARSGNGDLGFGIPIANAHHELWWNVSEGRNFRSICKANFKKLTRYFAWGWATSQYERRARWSEERTKQNHTTEIICRLVIRNNHSCIVMASRFDGHTLQYLQWTSIPKFTDSLPTSFWAVQLYL